MVGDAGVCAQPKATPVDDASYPKVLASHKGKVVLVSFWATWCVPCRKEMPELVKLEEKLHARGFDVVTISNDLPERETAAGQSVRRKSRFRRSVYQESRR